MLAGSERIRRQWQLGWISCAVQVAIGLVATRREHGPGRLDATKGSVAPADIDADLLLFAQEPLHRGIEKNLTAR